MIYELSYICDDCANDDYYYGGANYFFEADSDEEAKELARIETESKKREHVTNVHVHRIELSKAKDKIAELKKELEI